MIHVHKHKLSFKIIQSPQDLDEMTLVDRMELEEAFKKNNVEFFIPGAVNDFAQGHSDKGLANAMLEAYKIGFLKAVLSNIYPEKKVKEIFDIIRNQFQLFATTRKMEMRYTLYNKTPELHVFD